MATLPDRKQQIMVVHAELIKRVVDACGNALKIDALEPVLKASEKNGWQTLVARIRSILKGQRDAALLNGLDEEDSVIIDAILRGLQDPNTLAALNQPVGPEHAAPGLAVMIYGTARGDAHSLEMIGTMAQQMLSMGDDMARISGRLRDLVDGEREPDKLCKGLGSAAEKLMLGVIAELHKLEQPDEPSSPPN